MDNKHQPEEVEYTYHPLLKDAPEEKSQKDLTFLEIIGQAFSLVFALQKGKGLKRAVDLLETNPKSVILAGFFSMFIFFGICYTASQLLFAYYGI